MKVTPLSLLAVATLWLAHASQAAPIVYEGWNYPISSTVSNASGGTGIWTNNAWIGANLGGVGPDTTAPDFVITNGLSWSNSSGGYILATGGAIFDHDGSPHEEYRQWFDPSADFIAAYGTNIWFSFIATYDAASGSGGAVNPFETQGDTTAGCGVVCTGPAGGGNFIVQIRDSAHGQGWFSGSAANLTGVNGTNLVVGRFQLDANTIPTLSAGNDRLDVWLNQTTEPTNDSALYATGMRAYRSYPYSSGYLGIRTGGGCQMTIGEIRIGTAFADVVPATAKSANPKPAPPPLTLLPSGPVGLQFNTSEATPTNSNEIVTYYSTNSGSPQQIDATWVGKTPAAYSFTVATPPAQGPTNFLAYAWLIPNWNGHIQALDNSDALQLALVSDGQGNAKAVLGYYVGSAGNVQENLQALFTSGVICTIPSAPFAGTWTLKANTDNSFTIVAPNGAQASGTMLSGNESVFAVGTRFFLGVSPNGGSNVGNPSLGNYMTVSALSITNAIDGVVVAADWSTGEPLSAQTPPKFLVAANFPSCIYVMPSNSVYRATWANASGPGIGVNLLTTTNVLGGVGSWPTALPSSSVLSDGTNVTFITGDYLTTPAGFFRVSIPYTP